MRWHGVDMAEQRKQTALQRWGSQESTGVGKLLLYAGFALIVGALIAVGIYVGVGETDQRERLQEQLNSRYVEQIELHEQNTAGRPTVIIIDGTYREDCDATDDGHLECSDEPQPTLEDGAR